MVNESNQSSDDATRILVAHHTLKAAAGMVASLQRPIDMFDHSAEELLDLAHTHHHGGDPVVSLADLQAGLNPARNAVRVRVWDSANELKQLIFGPNCRSNGGGFMLMEAVGGDVAGTYLASRTSTSIGATSLTDTGASFPASTSTNPGTGLVGHIIRTGTSYGTIVSNTGTVATIDQWYSVGSTSGASASTPATGTYEIMPGQAPSRWIGVTVDTATEDIGDRTLATELLTGFATTPRWYGTYTVTTSPTGTGTANSTGTAKIDSGVQTANATNAIAKLGLFQAKSGGELMFEKKLTVAASVISGDTLDASWALSFA